MVGGYLTNGNNDFVFLFILLIVIGVVAAILTVIFKNPFKYPYFRYRFNISGKRNVDIEECIDRFLCDQYNWNRLRRHYLMIQQWKDESHHYLKRCKLKELRRKQYYRVVDDSGAFRFYTMRNQTRYRQSNYIKKAYKVRVDSGELSVSWKWIEDRHNELQKIGFEATLKEYFAQNQRSLMNKNLRKQIMERDNYTCQICGKKMFDEIGLQIDHIVPIARGGKTVPSNLQVLCNKCNARKGTK